MITRPASFTAKINCSDNPMLKRWKSDLSKCRLSQPWVFHLQGLLISVVKLLASTPLLFFFSFNWISSGKPISFNWVSPSPFPEFVSGCLFDKGGLCPPTDNLRSILHTGDDSTSLVILLTWPLINFLKDCTDFLIWEVFLKIDDVSVPVFVRPLS